MTHTTRTAGRGSTHMPSENDFARIRAEMLMQQAESPSYDDGASLLMRDPAMMEVGLFGRRPPKPMEPPVNLSRRGIIGLGQAAPENLPAVRSSDIPLPPSSTLPAPLSTPGATQPARPPIQQPTPPHTPTPLEALAQKAINAPMSRREVLQRAGQAAVNQMLPTPKIADVVPEIAAPLAPLSPLMQAAKAAEAVQSAFTPNALIDAYLGKYAVERAEGAYANAPAETAQGMWILSRKYLKDRLPPEDVQKLDRIAETPDGEYTQGSSEDISEKRADMLYEKMLKHLKTLKPHEQLDVVENMYQMNGDPAETAEDVGVFLQQGPWSTGGKKYKKPDIKQDELEKYLSDMYDNAYPSKE